MTPLVHELRPAPTVTDVLSCWSDAEHLLLLESPRRDARGRYSFLMADPFRVFQLDSPARAEELAAAGNSLAVQYGVDPFRELRPVLQEWATPAVAGLPPFQGGAAGLLGYELGGCWERLPFPARDEFRLPSMLVGLYDWVIAWDHVQNRCWIISQGQPGAGHPRMLHAQQRLDFVLRRLQQVGASRTASMAASETSQQKEITAAAIDQPGSCPATHVTGVRSNFSREGYLAAVQRVVDDIYAGDIFQANLSQRLVKAATADPLVIYQRLRVANPAPFAGYMRHADWAVLSSSPERFVELRGKIVRTRPIKGTRQRWKDPQYDLLTQDELRASRKDQAENVMIVDLMRNDLSRVCKPGSISVPELCTVETFETVTHLVSEICGTLRDGADFWDLIAATFPGGSITGAPKVRAMQIIQELEQVARGPYCGSLFYCGLDGTADSSILIRTMTWKSGLLHFPVGGGIVADSDPETEFEETLHKAQGLLRALES